MKSFLQRRYLSPDSYFKLISIQRASACGVSARRELIGYLDDPSPEVAEAAVSALHSISPMAALPERWPDTPPAGASECGHAPWLSRLCETGERNEDIVPLAVRHAKSLGNESLDIFLDRLALFQGMQQAVYRQMKAEGMAGAAKKFSRKVIELRKMQFPAQVFLSATMSCQLRCDFCIAEDSNTADDDAMTRADMESFMDWMSRHAIRRLSLTGGEPTLYPLFGSLLHEMRKRNIELNLATNGLFSDAVRDKIIESAPLCVTMHLAPEIRGSLLETYTRNARSFIRAGLYTVVRCNLTSPDEDYSRFITTALDTGIGEIRMAVPMPNAYRINRHAEPSSFHGYREILGAFVAEARRHGIRTRLSKPFPPCLLDEETAKVFLGNGSYSTNCPLHMRGYANNMIVYHDLSYSPCLGLNTRIAARIVDQRGPRTASLKYVKGVRNLMREPLFEHCTICPLSRGGRCLGACLSYRTISGSDFSLRVSP
jgi:MoaA/NifB/PqqE/SkfB family radical SAM enzyme